MPWALNGYFYDKKKHARITSRASNHLSYCYPFN